MAYDPTPSQEQINETKGLPFTKWSMALAALGILIAIFMFVISALAFFSGAIDAAII